MMPNQTLNNPKPNDTATLNDAKISRKRKRADSDEDFWTEVLNNIVSDFEANSKSLTSSDFSRDVSSNSSASNTELKCETSYAFERYNANEIENNKQIKAFSDEMVLEVASLCVSDTEATSNLTKVIADLESALRMQVPKHKWQYFGSYLNGLGCKDSDIDLYYESLVPTPYKISNRIEKILRTHRKFTNILPIKRARIPLIKLVHVDTRKECDISFTNEMGVRTSKLTKLYLSLNPHLKNLTIYLKYLLKKYDLQGTGKITTYILFWLIVYFMQEKKLLPPVIDIRKFATENEKYFVSGWDCSVPDRFPFSLDEPVSLYLLFRDFLKFYRDFDFLKYAICPYLACVFPLDDFENSRIPEEAFSIYLKKIRSNEVNSFSRHVINLQDPTDLSFNLAKQVDMSILNRFKIFCYYLYRLIPGCTVNNSRKKAPLSKILPVRLPDKGYQPENLVQFYAIHFNFSTLQDKVFSKGIQRGVRYIMESIRKIMEVIFAFKVKSVVTSNISRITVSGGQTIKNSAVPVIYFKYYTTSDTWKNTNILRVFSLPSSNIEGKSYSPFDVYIISEVNLERNIVRILIQSEVQFGKFLNKNCCRLLQLVLEQTVLSSK